MSNAQIAAAGRNIAPRTVRAHTRRLASMGLVEEFRAFPEHRYRWLKEAEAEHAGYIRELETISRVFGLRKK